MLGGLAPLASGTRCGSSTPSGWPALLAPVSEPISKAPDGQQQAQQLPAGVPTGSGDRDPRPGTHPHDYTATCMPMKGGEAPVGAPGLASPSWNPSRSPPTSTTSARSPLRFREVLAGCEPTARVPACPDWDAADLLWHLTTVQAFWAQVVSTRPGGGRREGRGAAPSPDTYDGLLAAFDEHSAALVDALAAADPAEEAWTGQRPHRRRELPPPGARGADPPARRRGGGRRGHDLDTALAADGVLEVLEVMYGGCPPWGTVTPSDRVVDVALTDTGDVLHVALARFTGTDPTARRTTSRTSTSSTSSAAPVATVTGTAAELDTWLWHRGADRVACDLEGDQAALTSWPRS